MFRIEFSNHIAQAISAYLRYLLIRSPTCNLLILLHHSPPPSFSAPTPARTLTSTSPCHPTHSHLSSTHQAPPLEPLYSPSNASQAPPLDPLKRLPITPQKIFKNFPHIILILWYNISRRVEMRWKCAIFSNPASGNSGQKQRAKSKPEKRAKTKPKKGNER